VGSGQWAVGSGPKIVLSAPIIQHNKFQLFFMHTVHHPLRTIQIVALGPGFATNTR
jgi:hypothetical protein